MVVKKKTYRDALPKNPEERLKVKLDKAHSPLKILAHKEMLKNFIEGKPTHPIHVRIGITNRCNIRCNFCNFHSENEADFYTNFSYKDELTTDQLSDFLLSFRKHGGKAATFCGSGECTIHPGYAQMCNISNREGLKIGLITNGTMLYKQNIKDCVINTHTWVRIGLNAGKPETYAKITNYKAEAFNQILKDIEEIRLNAKQPEFRIGVNLVITNDNYEEIVLSAQLAKNSGAHYIRFEPEFYTALGHRPIDKNMKEIENNLMEARELEDENFEVSIPKLDRGQMVATDKIEGDFSVCHYSMFGTALGCDGFMYPCPQVHLGHKYQMGNVIKKGYDNWIADDDKGEWFKNNPDRTKLCKTCFYRPQNELLEWLKRGDLNLDEEVERYKRENPDMIHTDFI
jgi:MoaA/NifB/PqqE/SkfB family radical SAM enzyme